jgi:hypothetical protein
MDLHIVGVQSHHMKAMWPHVEKYFRSFEERSRGAILAYDLLLQCSEAKRQCWVATDGRQVFACALTEVQPGPLKVVMLTFCAGEDMERWWREMVLEIKAWAKGIGSKRVMAIHRPGWSKFLAAEGFKMSHILSEVDI